MGLKKIKNKCPVCKNKKHKKLYSVDTHVSRFDLLRCGSCGLTRISPFPDDEFLEKHGITDYYGKDVNKFIPVLQKIRSLLMSRRAKYYLSYVYHRGKVIRVLDVGCGEGRLLNSFCDLGCECWGIEHRAFPVRRFINDKQIKYRKGNPEQLSFYGKFNIIFMWHSLEHMDDPSQIFKKINDLLAPGGAVILAVPNFLCLEAGIFRKHWFHLDIPWHKYHFSKESLYYLAEENNLKIIKQSTFCMEQGPYGIIQSLLNKSGLPKNDLYEMLKGNKRFKFSVQFIIAAVAILPASIFSFLLSLNGNGSVIKMILRKDE